MVLEEAYLDACPLYLPLLFKIVQLPSPARPTNYCLHGSFVRRFAPIAKVVSQVSKRERAGKASTIADGGQ